MPTIKSASVPPKRLSATVSPSSTGFKLNNIKDWDGSTDLTSARWGSLAYGAFTNPTRTRLEFFSFDPATIADETVMFAKRGLKYDGDYDTEVTANKQTWLARQTVVLLGTDASALLGHFIDDVNDQEVDGVKTYIVSPKVPLNPSAPEDVPSKSYVDSAAGAAGGITAFMVSQDGSDPSLAVNVASGRWMRGDAVQAYAGSSAQAVTANQVNYVQLRFDGTLVINTSGFLPGHLPLAEVTAGASDISSVVDRRAWLTLAQDEKLISSSLVLGATLPALSPVYVNTGNSNRLALALATGAATADVVAVTLDSGADGDANKRVYLPGSYVTGLPATLTANARVYLTDAGGFSGTPGTFRKVVGWANSTTSMFFRPVQSVEALAGANSATTTANLQELMTLINSTDVTGAELETVTSGESSDASAMHSHQATVSLTVPLVGSPNRTTILTRTVGFSDDALDRITLGAHWNLSSGSAQNELVTIDVNGGRQLLYRDQTTVAEADCFGAVNIGTDKWQDDGSTDIRKNGSSVTISGTARHGTLGYDAGSAHLLVMYSATKIARFSGVAGTTITNANADITLDTAVTWISGNNAVGFLWEDTNNMIYALDTTANLVRKFNSSGVTQSTDSYSSSLDDANFLGLAILNRRVHIVSLITENSGNLGWLTVQLIPTNFTV